MRLLPHALCRVTYMMTWLTGFTLAFIAVFFIYEKWNQLVLEESVALAYTELSAAEIDYDYFIHNEGTLLMSVRPNGIADELCVTWTDVDYIVALEEVKILNRLQNASERTLGLLLLRGRVKLSELKRIEEIKTITAQALKLYEEVLPQVESSLNEVSCFTSRYAEVEL